MPCRILKVYLGHWNSAVLVRKPIRPLTRTRISALRMFDTDTWLNRGTIWLHTGTHTSPFYFWLAGLPGYAVQSTIWVCSHFCISNLETVMGQSCSPVALGRIAILMSFVWLWVWIWTTAALTCRRRCFFVQEHLQAFDVILNGHGFSIWLMNWEHRPPHIILYKSSRWLGGGSKLPQKRTKNWTETIHTRPFYICHAMARPHFIYIFKY